METIDDIVREMRELGGKNSLMWSPQKYLNAFSDRIESAAKHTCEYAIPNYGCASENRYLEENARLRAALKVEEDAHEVTHAHLVSLQKEYDRSGELLTQAEADRNRLRAALKPVLECDQRSVTWHTDCTQAVVESQRIYNESEVK